MAPSFSDILTAVKPSQRTDQYVILAALYDLKAHAAPVTVGQVTDRIRRHRGKQVPVNISARLRKYDAYVEPANSLRPILWKLRSSGIEKLSELSGLSLPSTQESDAFESDIGIVCALEDPEFAAVSDAFGGANAWTVAGDSKFAHIYRETNLKTDAGSELRVVATVSTSMGLTAAAIATTQLIMQFKPKLVIMVGIAAGTRSGGKQFGDVLVADPSVDYNSGKVAEADGIRAFLPDPYPIPLNPRLRMVLKRYSRDPSVYQKIRDRWPGERPVRQNAAHIGPLGAADQVLDNHDAIIEIQKNWRKLIGVEMETYAVYRACFESPEPKPRAVSFKAVCDFAAEKSDSWQPYAAFVAAEFAAAFIKSEWESLWSSEGK